MAPIRLSIADLNRMKITGPKRHRKRKPKGSPQDLSELELLFLHHWKVCGHSGEKLQPVAQHKFHDVRGWRFDWAWPSIKVAVELHGGEFMKKSGHTTGTGLAKDCEKSRRAQINGWIVLPFTGRELKSNPVGCIDEVMEAIMKRYQERLP